MAKEIFLLVRSPCGCGRRLDGGENSPADISRGLFAGDVARPARTDGGQRDRHAPSYRHTDARYRSRDNTRLRVGVLATRKPPRHYRAMPSAVERRRLIRCGPGGGASPQPLQLLDPLLHRELASMVNQRHPAGRSSSHYGA
jgi:hypothetical protein